MFDIIVSVLFLSAVIVVCGFTGYLVVRSFKRFKSKPVEEQPNIPESPPVIIPEERKEDSVVRNDFEDDFGVINDDDHEPLLVVGDERKQEVSTTSSEDEGSMVEYVVKSLLAEHKSKAECLSRLLEKGDAESVKLLLDYLCGLRADVMSLIAATPVKVEGEKVESDLPNL